LEELLSIRNVDRVARFGFRLSTEDDVGLFSKDIKTLGDMLLHGLQDIYYAEQQITKALPKMIDQATNRDLAQGLKNHLEETTSRSSGSIRYSRSSARSRPAPIAPPSTA
jgi:hypothetical protein